MNASQPASNLYPSIPSEPPADRGGTESFYNMQSHAYAEPYPQVQPSYQESPHPQSPYVPHDKGSSRTASAYGTAPSLDHANYNDPDSSYATSQQGYHQSPAQRQGRPSFHESQYQGYQHPQDGVSQLQTQISTMSPPQTPIVPRTADSATMYYRGGHDQVSPQQPPHQQRQESLHDPSVSSLEQAQA